MDESLITINNTSLHQELHSQPSNNGAARNAWMAGGGAEGGAVSRMSKLDGFEISSGRMLQC